MVNKKQDSLPIVTKGVTWFSKIGESLDRKIDCREAMISLNQTKTQEYEPKSTSTTGTPMRRSVEGADRRHLVDRLQNQIRSIESVGRVADECRISSGCSAIDSMLPGSGYQRGTLVQWLTAGGQGADYLSLRVAHEACRDGGALVVFDSRNEFFPPAAAAIGINLDHLVVLRKPTHRVTDSITNDFLWSIDQALRCPAVAAVWGAIGDMDERWFRRFQLSAESSGCMGLFVQPLAQARQPSWADTQWLVGQSQTTLQDRRLESEGENGNQSKSFQRVHLQLTRCRGTQTGKSVDLTIDTVSGNVAKAHRDRVGQIQKNASRPGLGKRISRG